MLTLILKEECQMNLKVFVIVILFCLASFIIAEDPEPPKPVLKKGDVKHFIKTFPLLKKDFKDFGMEYEAKAGTVTIPEALKASEKFLEILKKHGWDQQFFTKMITITLGYSSIQYGAGIKKVSPEIEKSLKEIEANTALSAEMKEQLKKQIMAAKGVIKFQQEQLEKRIHKSDLDLIHPLIKELKKVMEAD
jgi:hypothetical protein